MGSTRSLSDSISSFIAWLELRAKPGTVAFYRRELVKWCNHLKNPELASIDRMSVECYSAKRNPLVSICRFLRWCVDVAELLPHNPSARVRVPKPGQRTRVLLRRERVLFRRRAGRSLAEAMLALYETASRPEEFRQFTWEGLRTSAGPGELAAHLVAGRCWWEVIHFKGADRRKDRSGRRIVVISPRLGRLMVRLLRRHGRGAGAVFRSPIGRAWTPNTFRCAFRRLRGLLAADKSIETRGLVGYLYRHSRLTDLARSGVNAYLLRDFAGHADVRTTMRYVHSSVSDLLDIGCRKIWRNDPRC